MSELELVPEKRQIGSTEAGRVVRLLLPAGFLLSLVLPLVWQLAVLDRPFPGLETGQERGGLVAANRQLHATLERIENHLEETSPLRAAARPHFQHLLSSYGRVGNRQVYLGRGGWLFFRPAIDHLTGPGFLDPPPVRGGERERDPLPAIGDLERLLRAHDVELLVMPIPGKGTIHPQALSRHAGAPARNRDELRFLERLEAAGIRVFDSTPTLREAAAAGEAQYLRTDSHWTPQGMERVAAALAAEIATVLELELPAPPEPSRTVITQRGDLARMLDLPPASRLYPPESAALARASPPAGDRSAPVLLLGDSFTNIYAHSVLGWGTGAGLAERLADHLGLPVEAIALNAGGAYASRERLHRELAADPSRLDNKRLAIYAFAARELTNGNWRRYDPTSF